MNERKDDIIIGLLVIIIIMQLYGLFFGQASTTTMVETVDIQASPTVVEQLQPTPPELDINKAPTKYPDDFDDPETGAKVPNVAKEAQPEAGSDNQ